MSDSIIVNEYEPIYMDNLATTPIDPRVIEAMMPYLNQRFGNSSSRHHFFGKCALEAIDKARNQIAKQIKCNPEEIIFTSGATESNNLALFGVMRSYIDRGRHMITLAIEHKSIIDPAKKLLDEGFDVTFLPVDTYGLLDLRDLVKAIRKDTVMVSMMSANNEIGVIQSVEEIGGICRKHNVIFHTDGAQAFCKMPIDVTKQSIDLLSLSSHKIYGPKGIGALYVRNQKPRVKLSPIIFGGGHERGLRSGTLNTPAIVGFGEACNITKKEMDLEQKAIKDLRNLLLRELSIRINDLRVNGSLEQRLSGNLNIEIPGVDSEALLFSLKKIAISSGSACTSHTFEPSHVLLALGLDSRRAMNCIRFGLGRFNTQEDIKIAVEEITYHVDRIRKLRGWI